MASPVAGLTGNGSMVAVLVIGPGNSTAMFMRSQALGPAPRASAAVRVCPGAAKRAAVARSPRSQPEAWHEKCAYRQDRSCPSHAFGGTHGVR